MSWDPERGPQAQGTGLGGRVFPEPLAASRDSLEFLFFGLCLRESSVGLFA